MHTVFLNDLADSMADRMRSAGAVVCLPMLYRINALRGKHIKILDRQYLLENSLQMTYTEASHNAIMVV